MSTKSNTTANSFKLFLRTEQSTQTVNVTL